MNSHLFDLLNELSISFDSAEHEAVFTCEDASRVAHGMEGIETKNLFLRDKKGKKHYLVAIPDNKMVDLKNLAEIIGSTKLSFASSDRLKKYLGVTPGSVTLLALINDVENDVEVIVDKDIWESKKVLCHPLVNTATVSIALEDMKNFFDKTGHGIKVLEL